MKTHRSILAILTLATAALAAAPATADDVTGAGKLLCASVEATVCDLYGECEMGPPWNWDIPQFIEVDLSRKILSTTPASGENRTTPILNMTRDQGVLFLQGVEGGRAFSFVIHESTGAVSAAIARDGITVSVFGACTPIGSKG